MGHVALTLDGRPLRLSTDESRRLTLCGATDDPPEVLERLELGHGRIALRTADDCFLAVRPDPGLSYAVYPEAELTPAAAFEEILWPDGRVALRSCHLTYVGADSAGRVTVNRTHAGVLERFDLVAAPAAVLPGQRQKQQRPAGQSSAPRATSASPSSSACLSERMISGTA